jgi:hypothetical protein
MNTMRRLGGVICVGVVLLLSMSAPTLAAVNMHTVDHSPGVNSFRKTVQILGQAVELDIYPITFWWDPGDGAEPFSTEWAGRQFFQGMDFEDCIYYKYPRSSDNQSLGVSVDTTWAAQYRVSKETGWQYVDETITVEGDPVDLIVKEYRPVLTGP